MRRTRIRIIQHTRSRHRNVDVLTDRRGALCVPRRTEAIGGLAHKQHDHRTHMLALRSKIVLGNPIKRWVTTAKQRRNVVPQRRQILSHDLQRVARHGRLSSITGHHLLRRRDDITPRRGTARAARERSRTRTPCPSVPRHVVGKWAKSSARRYAEAPSSVLSQQRLGRSPSVAAQDHDASAALLGRGHACR